MSNHTPSFIFAAMVELAGFILLFMVGRQTDGSYSLPVVAVAGFLILVGTAITVSTAIKLSKERQSR